MLTRLRQTPRREAPFRKAEPQRSKRCLREAENPFLGLVFHPWRPHLILQITVPITIAKSFFRYGKPYNPPYPLEKREENYKELLLKSPFGKGDLGAMLFT